MRDIETERLPLGPWRELGHWLLAQHRTASIRLAEAVGAEYEETIELLKHGSHRVYRYF